MTQKIDNTKINGSSVFPGVVMRIPYTPSDQETIF